MTTLNILMAQMNTLVGDFDGNTESVIATVNRALQNEDNPVVVFPELTLSGYPPEDLLLRPSIELRVNQSLEKICAAVTGDAYVVIGYPRRDGQQLYNAAGVIHRGEASRRRTWKAPYAGSTWHPRLESNQRHQA